MATDVQNTTTKRSDSAEPTSTVVSEIIADGQKLLQQQLALFQAEIRSDFRKVRDAAYPMVLGLGAAFAGAILLCLMLVYLLPWVWPDLPLWGAFGLVGGVLLVAGLLLFNIGNQQLNAVNPLPDESAQALQENLQWLKPK
jgi:hypothetical protein